MGILSHLEKVRLKIFCLAELCERGEGRLGGLSSSKSQYIAGYFGLACLKLSELAGKRINIAEYPEDKVQSKPESDEMW